MQPSGYTTPIQRRLNVDATHHEYYIYNVLGTLKERYNITEICLYKFDPLKAHFYIVKLGFTGVYIIFLFLLKNIDCGYSLEPPRRGGSNEYKQFMF